MPRRAPDRDPRVPLEPAIPIEAARFILKHCGGDLEQWIHRLERMRKPAALWQAGELREAVARMRTAVGLRNHLQAHAGSVVASTEVPKTADSTGLSTSSVVEAGTRSWVSVSEVASEAKVSDELVRRLCRTKVLEATHAPSRGRPYRIVPDSAAEWIESRRAR